MSAKMASRHITFTDVEEAIHNSNVELPAGKIKNTDLIQKFLFSLTPEFSLSYLALPIFPHVFII